jgi:hypothetical protein
VIASTTWYVARAGGWVAWLLLVVSVGWGLLTVIRLSRRPGRARRWNVIHRAAGWWTAVLVGLAGHAPAVDRRPRHSLHPRNHGGDRCPLTGSPVTDGRRAELGDVRNRRTSDSARQANTPYAHRR